MLIATLSLLSGHPPYLTATLHNNIQYADLMVFGCAHDADPSQREVITRFQAQGLPILVFDLPDGPAGNVCYLAMMISNLERFFQIDAMILLEVDELVVHQERRELERRVTLLKPLDCGEIHLASFGASAPGKWRRKSSLRAPRLLRGGNSASNVEAWQAVLEKIALGETGGPLLPVRVAWFGEHELVLPQPVTLRSDAFWEPLLYRRARKRSESGVCEERSRPGQITPRDVSLEHDDLPLVRKVTPTDALSQSPDLSSEGIWNADLHRRNFYLDIPPFKFIAEKYRPVSVVDFGCGLGGYVELFRRLGAKTTLGIDGFEAEGDKLVCQRESYRQEDLRAPLHLGRVFDLVISTEVIEHVDACYEEIFLDNLERHAGRWILFSAARPGQKGVGHVNCKPIEHWLDAWRNRGWVPHSFDTCAVRCLSTFFWFRRNLVLLVRDTAEDELSVRFRSAPAGKIEIETSKWFAQEPRVCRHAFSEPPPAIYPGED